jgi:hypothetical protein
MAIVSPILKKPSLDSDELKNYRPVSNLSYVSKLTEKCVAQQLIAHCNTNGLLEKFQSAYRPAHSTETALARVQNDLLRATDSTGGALLILLDLSAAFDTLDHDLLLHSLWHRVHVTDDALAWFNSYLRNRLQHVAVGTSQSDPNVLRFGVPQGSVLGPILFCLYMQPLARLIESMGLDFHTYADDLQLYMPVNLKSREKSQEVISKLTECSMAIKTWMAENCLKLNDDKTELLAITTPAMAQHRHISIDICGALISSSSSARNLGVIFDSSMSMKDAVASTCRRAFYQIYLIRQIRDFITEDAARTLVQANVTSLLDYCNSLLVGLPKETTDRLQRIQNAATRVVKQVYGREHITPILRELHWLPVAYKIKYKVNMLSFKSLRGLAPTYLQELFVPYIPTRLLRSQGQGLLTVPRFKRQTVGGRAFATQGASLWNELPPDLRNEQSLNVF